MQELAAVRADRATRWRAHTLRRCVGTEVARDHSLAIGRNYTPVIHPGNLPYGIYPLETGPESTEGLTAVEANHRGASSVQTWLECPSCRLLPPARQASFDNSIWILHTQSWGGVGGFARRPDDKFVCSSGGGQGPSGCEHDILATNHLFHTARAAVASTSQVSARAAPHAGHMDTRFDRFALPRCTHSCTPRISKKVFLHCSPATIFLT